MSGSHLDIKLLEVTEQGRMGSELKMVTPNYIKHKPVRCNASVMLDQKIWKAYQPEKTADEDDEEAEDHDTSGMPTPMYPFLLVLVELVETLPPADFLPLEWASFPLSTWGFLAKDGLLDPDTGLFCTMKWNPVHGLVLLPLSEGKDWDKPIEDSCWPCARDQLIQPYRQASLGGIPTVKKREL